MAYMDIYNYNMYITVPQSMVSYSADEAENKYNRYVVIDDELAHPIQLLNKKGYKTKFCCSGHYGYEFVGDVFGSYGGYIFFKDAHKFKTVPEGVVQESAHILRFAFQTDPNTNDRFYELNTLVYNISKWADELEDISE